MYDLIDRIVNLDIGSRGVDGLYAPARALGSGPICRAAAEIIAAVAPGEHVLILTGSLCRSWVSLDIGESDGPVGVAALARAISYGFDAVPVVLTDETLLDKTAAMVRLAGPTIVTREQAKSAHSNPRFTSVALVDTCSTDDARAREEAPALLDRYRPRAVISVERAGMTADGTYRNAIGQDYSYGRARLDYVVAEARARGIPTIGVGDGGNEIGMGAIADAVREHIPHGDVICAALATDVLLPVGVSNWGCYAIQAALALLTGRRELAHPPALERELIEAIPRIGFVDGPNGKAEPTVDQLPVELHVGLVQLLATTVDRGLAKRG